MITPFFKDAHQQVGLGTQIPLVPCDGGVSGLHHYHPCTMPGELPL